jgi:hypothetical protein
VWTRSVAESLSWPFLWICRELLAAEVQASDTVISETNTAVDRDEDEEEEEEEEEEDEEEETNSVVADGSETSADSSTADEPEPFGATRTKYQYILEDCSAGVLALAAAVAAAPLLRRRVPTLYNPCATHVCICSIHTARSRCGCKITEWTSRAWNPRRACWKAAGLRSSASLDMHSDIPNSLV